MLAVASRSTIVSNPAMSIGRRSGKRDRHGETQRRRSAGVACRRAAPYRRPSGFPAARAAALALEAPRNPGRCGLTTTHCGLARMLTIRQLEPRDLMHRRLLTTSIAQFERLM